MDQCVCGVIVSYHPDVSFGDRIAALRPQVDHLIVVDNHSSKAEVDQLRELAVLSSFTLIENADNMGIATALNQGVRQASDISNLRFVVLFDQDSTVTEGFMVAMLREYEVNPHRDRIAILVPRYVDDRLGNVLPARYDSQGGLETAMTSGSLIPASIFAEVGWFEDKLFIGGVDFEYSLRVRSRGYLIRECKSAVLLHEPATPRIHRLGRLRVFTTSNYSALRRYYSERNRIWIRSRYWKIFPGYCFGLYISSAKEWIKILLGESKKWQKFYFMGLGISDGLRGKMGRKLKIEGL